MVRNYKRQPGSRPYMNYSEQQLKDALQDITNKKKSFRAASRHYNIPLNTLVNRLRQKHNKKHGGQTKLCEEEELLIKSYLLPFQEEGLPLKTLTLRTAVKIYLDSTGKNIKQFHNNMPGIDWVKSFTLRHGLQLSTVGNISKQQAAVSPEVATASMTTRSKSKKRKK